jgi:hypothetical protein
MWWRARKARALLWHLFARSAWALSATVLASTTIESPALASVLSVGVVSASHCGGGHDRRRRGYDLCACAAWAQLATVVAGTTDVGAALASVRSVGVCSASHCVGGHDCSGRYSVFWSLVWRGLKNAPVVAGKSVKGAVLVSVRSVDLGSVSHLGGENDR